MRFFSAEMAADEPFSRQTFPTMRFSAVVGSPSVSSPFTKLKSAAQKIYVYILKGPIAHTLASRVSERLSTRALALESLKASVAIL